MIGWFKVIVLMSLSIWPVCLKEALRMIGLLEMSIRITLSMYFWIYGAEYFLVNSIKAIAPILWPINVSGSLILSSRFSIMYWYKSSAKSSILWVSVCGDYPEFIKQLPWFLASIKWVLVYFEKAMFLDKLLKFFADPINPWWIITFLFFP